MDATFTIDEEVPFGALGVGFPQFGNVFLGGFEDGVVLIADVVGNSSFAFVKLPVSNESGFVAFEAFVLIVLELAVFKAFLPNTHFGNEAIKQYLFVFIAITQAANIDGGMRGS